MQISSSNMVDVVPKYVLFQLFNKGFWGREETSLFLPFAVNNQLLTINPNVKQSCFCHHDVIEWKHFPRYFVRGIHQSPVDSTHKGQWRWALMFSLICARTNGWATNRHAGALRCHRAHCDVTVMDAPNVIDIFYLFIMINPDEKRSHRCRQNIFTSLAFV